jgi:tRNA A-37 threonylcarbamoyl transferase component Bud32
VIPAPDIPGHSVTGVLGSGGFATVYRTWQVAVGRETAVKVDSRVLHAERDERRFFREVRAAGRLSGHPNVIDVYDAGTLRDGRPYLVMELCPGGSLNDEVRRSGPMSAARACRVGVSLADALAAAHASGVLHRDIKPANILVNRYGVVGLSDFGLASIIEASGEQSVSRDALTPAYAPPESFHEAEPTAAADVYSLAATLYALMAGRPPRFPAGGPRSPGVATILALHGQPVDDIPGLPPPMLAILRQCLAADPAQRLPSAAALRDGLATLLEQPALFGAFDSPSTVLRNRSTTAAPPLLPAPLTRSAQYAGIPGPDHALTSPPARPGAETTEVPGLRRHPTLARPRARPMALATLGGGGLVLVIVAALIVMHRLAGPGNVGATGSGAAGTGAAGTGAAAAIGTFGIATTTSHCPAASVPGAGARCPASPECWNGVNENEGVITVGALPCDQPHTWQTFAIGIMPSDASTIDVNVVQANPAVRAVCSSKVLLRSRAGRALPIPAGQWRIQVAPPDEADYNTGVRTYRCLASSAGLDGARTSQFGA